MRALSMWRSVWRRRAAVPGVRQRDQSDCGAACLASICRFYGAELPVARIRQFTSTDRQGTTVLGMVEGAQRIGLSARGVRATSESLREVPLPAIAHVTTSAGAGHYVVLVDVSGDRVRIMDPREGRTASCRLRTFLDEWTRILILVTPTDRLAYPDGGGRVHRRLFQLGLPHRAVFLQAFVGSALYTLLGLSTAIFVQKLIDNVLPGANQNLLNLMAALMLVLLVVQMGIGVLKDLLIVRTGQRIDGGLILQYYRHVLSLPQRFFDTMRVGEVVSRVNDAVKIRGFINDVALELAVSATVVVLSFGLMVAYSPPLALLVALVIPVYGAIYWVANALNRTTQRKLMEQAADLEAELVESIGAGSTLKRFSIEERAAVRVEERLVRTLRSVYRSTMTAIGSRTGSDLASRAALIVSLWVGGTMVLSQRMSAGELLSFYALIGYLASPIMTLIGSNRALQDALIAADRLFEIMDLEPESEVAEATEDPPFGDLEFDDVHFRYGARTAVLQGVTAKIRAGEITMVVGGSGCGKTTLASLLQALYPLDAGTIRVGGRDLRRISPDLLRRHIGVVPQEIHLFAGTILENIALGDDQPDMQRLLTLCDELGITEFCDRLPNGMRTHIGERGASLSGGQRQRVAIARALYREPKLLILDEATSGLDPESEARVEGTIRRFTAEGGTVLLITHRLGLARLANRLLVMAEGRVVEAGTHGELMLRGGPYAEMWYRQFPAELGVRSPETARRLSARRPARQGAGPASFGDRPTLPPQDPDRPRSPASPRSQTGRVPSDRHPDRRPPPARPLDPHPPQSSGP